MHIKSFQNRGPLYDITNDVILHMSYFFLSKEKGVTSYLYGKSVQCITIM